MITGCAILAAMLRFERKLERTEDGHRIWTGAQTRGGCGRYKIKKHKHIGKRLKGKPRANNGPKYGKFWVGPDKKDTVQAHVFAAFMAGKIKSLRVPDGMHLDHECSHGGLCVDCTQLKPASVNTQLARTRPIRAPHRPSPTQLRKRSKGKRRQSGNPKNFRHRQKEVLTASAD